MLYNLTDIFSTEAKEETLMIPYERKTVTYQSEEYPITECSELSLRLANKVKGEIAMQAEMTLVCEVPCNRCLKPVSVPVTIQVDEYLKESEIGTPEAVDEMSYLDGYNLDTDKLIENEIMINWPMKVLCHEDCKGICTVCGKDLNEGECGCDRFVPDPRMAVIKDIFNA